jgi:dUTP pyrophosphatase
MDVRAAEDVYIDPLQTVIIPTGLKVAIPQGYEIQVRPRSGVSIKTPLRISNSIGTVDSGFRNEIGVIITNTSPLTSNPFDVVFGGEGIEKLFTIDEKNNSHGTYFIKKGDRIAQLVLNEVPMIDWKSVDSVKDIGINREGGFGSTGTK